MDSIPNTLIPFPEIRRKNKGVPEKQKKKGVLTLIIVTLLSCVLFVHSNFALGFGVHIFFFYFRYLFSPLPVHCLLLHIYGILSWRRRFILSSFLMHIS